MRETSLHSTPRRRFLATIAADENVPVTANIGNIRAQGCWEQSEYECRSGLLGQSEHEYRA